MHAFDYLSVLLSIVLGLGMTQLLSAVARWLELRHETKTYLPAAIWAAMLMIVLVQTWWTMFGLRNMTEWNFLQFCVVLVQPVMLYLLTALVLPGAQSKQQDQEAFFLEHRTWFYGLLMALLAASITKDVVLRGSLPGAPNLIFHAVFFAGSLFGLSSRKRGVQLASAVAGLVLMLVYVTALFAELA